MESAPPAGSYPTVAEDPALGLSPRAKLEILGAIMLALFLAALDQTIVGVALPRITTDLHATNELYVWSITIYLLTSTITGPFYGKLSDLYGRRPMLMIGVSLFLIGSALSGLSGTMEQLILFRGIQGLGAGALFPIALAVIGDLFTPAERGKYQGLFGAVFGLSSIIGPLLGGYLTDNISWHWIFYVNLPIGIVALGIIWRLLPSATRKGTRHNLDYLGAFVFTIAISALLIGLTYKGVTDPATGASYAWTDPIVGGAILLGVLLTGVFLWVESRAKEPIVPLSLFRNQTYSVSILATFLASFGFFGAIVFLPRWFQVVRGISPTESGLQSLALLAGLILSSIVSGAIISRTGRYKWLLTGSLAVMTVGMLLLTQLHADTPLPVLWVWMFVTGVGIGPTLAGFTIVVQNAVSFRELGVATSNLTFFRQIGGSIGLAIVGTLFATTYSEQLPKQLSAQGVPAQFVGQLVTAINQQSSRTTGTGDLAAALRQFLPAPAQPFVDNIVAGIHEAFSVAVAQSFWLGVGAAVIATVVAAAALKELPLRRSVGPETAPAGTVPATGMPAGSAPSRQVPAE